MSTLTLVVTSLQSSQEQGEGVRLAAAFVLMVPSILVYLGLQRFFERGLLSGSLKG
jgi:multiple sugar transport system permease protein